MPLAIDLVGPAFYDNPYPTYRVLRDSAPAYLHEPKGLWVLSRYDDVAAALTDPAVFSSAKGNVVEDSPLRVGRTLGSLDPPKHDLLRAIILRGFTPARLQVTVAAIRADLRERLSRLHDVRRCDFVRDLSRPVLFSALARMLGLDEAASVKAVEICEALFLSHAGPLGASLAPDKMTAVFALLTEQFAKRKTETSDDLFSVLIAAQSGGAVLSNEEVIANMTTVLMAGNASIGHFVPNIVHALWAFPDQRRMLREDPALIDDAIEETLRWDTSTQSFARQTTRETSVAGTRIPADSRVLLLYASANRDERAVPDPDRFDMTRGKFRHLGLGTGPHLCLGAQTARLFSRIFLEELLPVLGDYDLDLGAAERVQHVMVRGFRRLPIRW